MFEKNKFSLLALVFIFTQMFFPYTTFCQENKFDELAKKIINTSATVKPGEVVVVMGGKHTIPLMEALTIEAQKAGAMPIMFLETEKVIRSRWTEVDEKYLYQDPTFLSEWLKQIDVWISLPTVENAKAIYAGIPREKLAKAAKAGQKLFKILNESGIRFVTIDYPTKEDAMSNKLDFDTYKKMYWDAINADYQKISETGNKIKQLLEHSKLVRITSPLGTDFTFQVGNRPVFVVDGIVTNEEAKSDLILIRLAKLPGGQMGFTAIETSANGKVIIDRAKCHYKPLTGISFEFKNGKLQNFKAEQGEKCFWETLKPYDGPKDRFASVFIGLNPALKVIGDYQPADAAGMVWINIGGNKNLQGENDTQGGFEFPIVKATVTIDGKVVVKDGRLTLQ